MEYYGCVFCVNINLVKWRIEYRIVELKKYLEVGLRLDEN